MWCDLWFVCGVCGVCVCVISGVVWVCVCVALVRNKLNWCNKYLLTNMLGLNIK